MAAERCCVGRGVAAVRHKTGSRSYTYYTTHALRDDFARFEAEGTVFGAISKKDFQAIDCLAPPRELVEGFERLPARFDERIPANEQESGVLAGIRDALLPKLLSGEIRVKGAEKTAEEVVS